MPLASPAQSDVSELPRPLGSLVDSPRPPTPEKPPHPSLRSLAWWLEACVRLRRPMRLAPWFRAPARARPMLPGSAHSLSHPQNAHLHVTPSHPETSSLAANRSLALPRRPPLPPPTALAAALLRLQRRSSPAPPTATLQRPPVLVTRGSVTTWLWLHRSRSGL